MVAVGDQRGAIQPLPTIQPHARGDGIADHADAAGDPEGEQVVGGEWVDDPVDRDDAGDDGAAEDGQDDAQPSVALGTVGAQQEGDGQRDGCERVAGVVDQVRQQRDAAGSDVDCCLRDRRGGQNGERRADDQQPVARSLDRCVDEPMAVLRSVAAMIVLGEAVAVDASFRRSGAAHAVTSRRVRGRPRTECPSCTCSTCEIASSSRWAMWSSWRS